MISQSTILRRYPELEYGKEQLDDTTYLCIYPKVASNGCCVLLSK